MYILLTESFIPYMVYESDRYMTTEYGDTTNYTFSIIP